MYLSIKNDKQYETPRGVAWDCDLFVNGKKAADASNPGNGGATVVIWTSPEMEGPVRAHARANPITIIEGDITFTADGEGPEWDGNYILALAESRGIDLSPCERPAAQAELRL